MYYAFFGLKQPPLRITPDTDFFFEGGNRGAVLAALIYAITRGEGMVKVTGEVGSGKTMLCRVLQARLPATVETVYLANPSVSVDEILHAIAFELQLPLPRDAARLEVMHALNEYLLAKHAEGKQVVLFVEESQSMPLSTLEEIRLLSNLETRHCKLLQIVLFGQPELDVKLRRSEIRQLRERITHSFALAPLDARSVRDYLLFRLRAAGYHGPDLFSPRVIALMTRATGGLTRRINIVADKAMLAAFSDNTHNIQSKHVRAAIADSEFSGERFAWMPRPGWAALAALALVALAAGVLLEHLVFRVEPAAPARARRDAAVSTPAAPGPTAGGLAARPAPSGDPARAGPARTGTTAQGSAPVAGWAIVPARIQMSAHTSTLHTATQGSTPGASRGPAAPTAQAAWTVRSDERLGPGNGPPQSASPMPRGAYPASLAGDLLEQRLLATERWLAEANGAVFSIQLLGSTDQQMLRKYLHDLSNYIRKDRIFVCRTVANQAPSITVLYGAFAARADAVRSLNELPLELRANSPSIRTVQGIRGELGLDKPS